MVYVVILGDEILYVGHNKYKAYKIYGENDLSDLYEEEIEVD